MRAATSESGTFRTCRSGLRMSVLRGKADLVQVPADVAFDPQLTQPVGLAVLLERQRIGLKALLEKVAS
jgi:hypothetical protein